MSSSPPSQWNFPEALAEFQRLYTLDQVTLHRNLTTWAAEGLRYFQEHNDLRQQVQTLQQELNLAQNTSANSAIPQGAAPMPWAPGTPGTARAECSYQASPGLSARARWRHSRVLAPGVARADYSCEASPQQGARARRRHSRVLAPGDASIRARCPQSSMFSVWQHQGA
ncbi:uncharacterized protein H6S33_010545 [Morchella sextelata]|uniref:uncharacterized protein n=1 Tax=Morchella sextelata TaxID=1174677 RepID=UPI001D0386C5|nr:uncharacterized protein H6S33_010545 [Morchella sextelata]KAH0611280.1 hypothetical protein H6S33_010545 [Morchella sextelata]